LELGFDSVGITDLSPTPHVDKLEGWLAAGMAGTMSYMERQLSRRRNPSQILPGATHAVMLTWGYYTTDPPRTLGTGQVARYARGRDYHEALKNPLESLAAFVRSIGDDDTIARAYVDAGPVPERELAQRAGLGWIGKNTMVIDPRRGSFFFVASVLTNLELSPDPPFDLDRCGTCTRCLDACPAQAFPEPHILDGRRCISYLTIEHRGQLEEEQRGLVHDWVFGCDVCQDVCPWNTKFARETDNGTLGLLDELAFLDLAEIEALDHGTFERRYGWTPLERAGLEGLRRNAALVRRNSGEA
jgi:epoxyqueuosine reductase